MSDVVCTAGRRTDVRLGDGGREEREGQKNAAGGPKEKKVTRTVEAKARQNVAFNTLRSICTARPMYPTRRAQSPP